MSQIYDGAKIKNIIDDKKDHICDVKFCENFEL